MWVETPIEKTTFNALVEELQESAGKDRYGLYTTARKDIVEQIAPNINAVMPNHTDHGPEHIAHVLKNAGKLLQIESNPKPLTAMELYSLILGVVFHDTGNIHGRKNHQRNVSGIYDFCRSSGGNDHQEKLMILKMTEAHCGKALDGSSDTIRAIGPESTILAGYRVRLRYIAAILRFADELAEGKERTSSFMLQNYGYDKRSKIFHDYANISTVDIDPGNERIALTYNIEVKNKKSGGISNTEEGDLKKILEYCYQRIAKLDQERKYAKHYCDLLSRYKYTSVTFNFWIRGEWVRLGLPEAYTISDLVVPGEKVVLLNDRDKKFKVDNIIRGIKRAASRR